MLAVDSSRTLRKLVHDYKKNGSVGTLSDEEAECILGTVVGRINVATSGMNPNTLSKILRSDCKQSDAGAVVISEKQSVKIPQLAADIQFAHALLDAHPTVAAKLTLPEALLLGR